MNSGLEAKQITVKGQQVWAVVHTASGRSMSPRYMPTRENAEQAIAAICRAVPEADWALSVAELTKIPNLQLRILAVA